MSRLVTFGCSHTYGHGLEDCLTANNQPGQHPSKFAWPVILGTMMELATVNMSEPGSSNLRILHDILNFEFQEDDQIIVLWSHLDRDLIFLEKPDYYNGPLTRPIGSWNSGSNKSDIESWINVHTHYDMKIRSLLYVHHAEKYLETLALKNNHFSAQDDLFENIPSYIKFNNIHNTPLWDPIMSAPRANDNSHMGIEGHNQVAKAVYKTLKL
jgi:hypothetical protein